MTLYHAVGGQLKDGQTLVIFIPFIFTSSCFPGKLPTSILNVDCIPCTASLSPVPVANISLVLTNKSKGESKS